MYQVDDPVTFFKKSYTSAGLSLVANSEELGRGQGMRGELLVYSDI
jgi:hypothetical protein